MPVVAVNDVAFQFTFGNRALANRALHELLSIFKELRDPKYTAAEKVYGTLIDGQTEIAPGVKLVQMLREFETKDEQRLLIHILNNLPCPEFEQEPFYVMGKASPICAFAKDGVLLSLNSHACFSEAQINGAIGGQAYEIRNIATHIHLDLHEAFLGRRMYEKSEKHRLKTYFRNGNEISPIIVSDAEAQMVLDKAVQIGDRLYAKEGGRYFVFHRTHGNTYHGFQPRELPRHIRERIDKEFDG